MNSRRILIFSALILSAPIVFGNVLLDPDNIRTAGEPVLSKWYGYRQYREGPGDQAFSNALLCARAAHVPMLTLWSSPECHFCDGFATMLNSPECRAYIASKKVMFAYFKSGNALSYEVNCDPASAFAYQYIHQSRITGYWPHLRFEWSKPDGTTVAQSWSFVTNQRDEGHVFTLDEFRTKLESLLVGYDNRGSLDYFGGSIGVSDTADSRLEAQVGVTKTVWVPLKRAQSATGVATNQVFRWTYGTATGTEIVAWGVGDSNKFVKVDVPADSVSGTAVALQLEDLVGTPAKTGVIHLIDPQDVDQENPYWIGEKEPDCFEWGEWTMDLDAATQKVAAAVANGTNAYTLALCGGELWCGDCKGTRKYLCDTPQFKEWARTNHVALVLIDIPSSGTSPTMLTWDETSAGVSGAYYLSRKGVAPDEAQAIFNRNHDLCFNIWYKEYENRPSHRVWVPTMVLLAGDGLPHGRLLGDRKYPNNPEYPSGGVVYGLETYMRRLNELLELADDPTEWDNNDWSTTTLRLPADGTLSSTLSTLDGNSGDSMNQKVIDVIELTGCRKDFQLTIGIFGDQTVSLLPKLIAVLPEGGAGDRIEETVGPRFTLSSGLIWTVTNRLESARLFLALNGDDTAFFAYNRDADSTCRYTVRMSSALVCAEAAATQSVQPGRLPVCTEAGEAYVFSGVGLSVSPDEFESLGEGRFRALKSGIFELEIRDAGTLTYQLWRTGRLSFAEQGFSVSERAGLATVTVCRQDGSAGIARVRVVYAGGTARSLSEDPEYGSFKWDGDVIFVWPDGIATNQSVSFPVIDRSPRWEGDQTVVFELVGLEGSSAATVEPTNCTVSILEQDPKSVGRLRLQWDDPSFSETGVAYARAGDSVAFSIRRIGGANTDVSVAFATDDGGSVVSPATATWPNNGDVSERTFVLKLDEGLPAGEVVTVRVLPIGIGMADGIDRFSVIVIGDEAPRFEVSELDRELVRFTECNERVRVISPSGEDCRLVRVSGSLPEGVRAFLLDGETHFTGIPVKCGEFLSTWRIDGVGTDGLPVAGESIRVIFSVLEAGDVCAAANDETFPGGAACISRYSGFAVSEEDGLSYIVALTARADGVMRMTLEGVDGKSDLTSGSWMWANGDSIGGRLISPDCGSSCIVAWTNAAGSCSIVGTLRESSGREMELRLFPANSEAFDVDVGVYTVDFAPQSGDGGHAFISVRVSMSVAYGTRALYAGLLPDGRPFSGSVGLVKGFAGWTYLPIFRRTASGVFRALLCIRPHASGDDAFYANYNHSVSSEFPVWWNRPRGLPPIEMTAGGGYYDGSLDFSSISLLSDLTTLYRMDLPWQSLVDAYAIPLPLEGISERMIQVVGGLVTCLPIRNDVVRLQFSHNRASGVFSGKFLAYDGIGAMKAINYRGVLLPNWGEACKSGCGGGTRPGPFKPFGVGTAYISGHPGLSGAEIKFVPIQDE